MTCSRICWSGMRRRPGSQGCNLRCWCGDDEPSLARATHRGATHIVKSFDSREYPELAANEYFCLRAAVRAGLPAPRARLSENRRVLVIDPIRSPGRRNVSGVRGFLRIERVADPHGRYHGAYEDIAKRVSQFVSGEEQHGALTQLFTTVALCCAVDNGDAHLKNFAVLYEQPEGAVRLAPVYDVISTTLYNRRDVLALTLGGSKAFPERGRVSDFGRRACGLSKAQVDEALERVRSGVEGASADIREYMREHTDFERTGESLIATFSTGRCAVAEQLRRGSDNYSELNSFCLSSRLSTLGVTTGGALAMEKKGVCFVAAVEPRARQHRHDPQHS